MTGFLDRLAALALGEVPQGAARVALPPRFLQRPPEAGEAPGVPRVESSEGPPASQRATAGAGVAAPPPWSSPESPSQEGVDPAAPLAAAPATRAERRDATSPTRPAAHPAGERDPVHRAPRLPETSPWIEDPSAPQSPTVPYVRAAASVAAPMPAPTPGVVTSGPVRPPAPLSAAALAARSAMPVREAPVVHITIDRIDIRAPAAPTPAATPPRRKAPSPSTSLADFLRGHGPGERR